MKHLLVVILELPCYNREQLLKKIISSMFFDVKVAVKMEFFITSYTISHLQVFDITSGRD